MPTRFPFVFSRTFLHTAHATGKANIANFSPMVQCQVVIWGRQKMKKHFPQSTALNRSKVKNYKNKNSRSFCVWNTMKIAKFYPIFSTKSFFGGRPCQLKTKKMKRNFPKSEAPNPSKWPKKVTKKLARVLCFKIYEQCQFLPKCVVSYLFFWGGGGQIIDRRIIFVQHRLLKNFLWKVTNCKWINCEGFCAWNTMKLICFSPIFSAKSILGWGGGGNATEKKDSRNIFQKRLKIVFSKMDCPKSIEKTQNVRKLR